MPRLIVTTLDGKDLSIDIEEGATLMEGLRAQGVDGLDALCGGCCSCATCHVHVDPAYAGHMPPMSADENDLLDSCSGRRATSRLSCQIPVIAPLDGMRVTIATD
ncbi:2Fe-2S iron-sulfur cluster-binding protein [Niveispirillum fermenti]|uniref:2Fe-2S iron-sulfur cluster-binding protein n=1 Tax=Niveispirillum fermenti TaxID=1233113 RepID=UPI003A89AB4C